MIVGVLQGSALFIIYENDFQQVVLFAINSAQWYVISLNDPK